MLTLPTAIPATVELPQGFSLKFRLSPVTVATEASLREGTDEIWFECGNNIAEALLELLACLDEDICLPAPTALALRDLAHEAVDVVCRRLSAEPLDSAVFADPFPANAPIHCPVCGCEMVMDYDGGELVCSSEECDARQPIEWPEKFVQGVTEMVVGRPLQIPTYAPSAPQEVAG